MTVSGGLAPKHARLLGEATIAWSNLSERLQKLFVVLADLDNPYVVGVFLRRIKDAQIDDVISFLTSSAIDELLQIHHRNPLPLPRDWWGDWLDPKVIGVPALR